MEREVSQKWQERFDLMDKVIPAGKWYLDKAELKSLTYSERQRIGFSLLAFIFSVFYYYAKGMWAKASLLLSLTYLASIVLVNVDGILGYTPALAVMGFCAGFAKLDYYHKVRRQERMWPIFPDFFGAPWFAVALPIAAIGAFTVALAVTG